MPRAEMTNLRRNRRGRGAWLPTALGFFLSIGVAWAGGPRWVTGPPYFTGPSGNAVVWFTTQPLYFTDPADLSASVNHAAADALVAAAAAVWNVPTAAMAMAYGGALQEHVSGANAYLGSNGPVFPQDVQSGNYAAVQIAVLYDSDGSITDMLLGGGASDPLECRQNGVTESVDLIAPAGSIQHAILVLNGRCTGPAQQQQLQLQYQLERAFGRVLGVGWSQTNDNVFTQSPPPLYEQALHWPIMHPIDIVCGAYTYQCLLQPFTLRDDDVAAITTLYPMRVQDQFPSTPPAPGKVWSYLQAGVVNGTVSFPTGEGMQGVNVVLQRQLLSSPIPEGFYDVSSVSGFLYQQNAGNPVTGAASGMQASMGSTSGQLQGFYNLGWIPEIDQTGASGPMFAEVTTEPINPLYTGAYSVGPYVAGSVSPSGAAESEPPSNWLPPYQYGWDIVQANFAPGDAAGNCNTGGDGVESAPQPVTAGGWWTGVLCAHGHSAWSSFTAQAGRTATLEVTALDESGEATTAKAMPLIGVWAATDATGTPPTAAATPSAFNTVTLGMTAAHVATAQAGGLRFVIADARGDGRPDFQYQARVLYADTIQPAITSLSGGQVTILGMGFRAGNQVLVNGVPAAVSSWTATVIVAVAPPESAFATNPNRPVDVAVVDLSTGGTTVMTAALTYSNIAPDQMVLVSAPSGTVAVMTAAATPFAVRMVLGDGVTPVAGLPVTFSVASGSAQLGACAAPSCVVLTDATGLASTTITPTAFGSVTVQAAAAGAAQSASFNAVARSIAAVQPAEYVAAGTTVVWAPQMTVVEDGAPAAGVVVTWTGAGGLAVSPATSVAGAAGVVQGSAVAGPLAAGVQATGQACAWTTVCASFWAVGVDPSALRLTVVGGAGQAIAVSGTFAPVVLLVTDGQGDPVAGAAVAVHQTVDAAEGACPSRGPCPAAPVLGASATTEISDANGQVSVTPMQVEGVAEMTNVAAAAGTQGFVSLSLAQGQ
jgi:hypothetical protein